MSEFLEHVQVGPAPLARGARLAVDVGGVRVGLAASDPDGIMANPVATLNRDRSITYRQGGAIPRVLPKDIAQIVAEVEERSAAVVYIGQPRHLSGKDSESSAVSAAYGDLLAQLIAPVPVYFVDERLTTVTAHQALYTSGRAGKKHRSVVDQVAAVIILETAMETEKNSGKRAGTLAPVR